MRFVLSSAAFARPIEEVVAEYLQQAPLRNDAEHTVLLGKNWGHAPTFRISRTTDPRGTYLSLRSSTLRSGMYTASHDRRFRVARSTTGTGSG